MDTILTDLRDCYRSNTAGSAASFTAFIDGNRDWSLARLYSEAQAQENPELANALARRLAEMNARHVFAPTPTRFNGIIVQPHELNVRIPLAQGRNPVTLWRNGSVFADGTLLMRPGDAGMFSAGGCAMVVVSHQEHMAFGHAGLRCVVDEKRVWSNGAKHGRPHESVAHSLFETLRKAVGVGFNVSLMEAWVLWSIRPEDFHNSFADPKYGAWNGQLASYVQNTYGSQAAAIHDGGVEVDIPIILQEQFRRMGVPWNNVRLGAAYLPDNFPHTRNGNHRRYIIGVVRTR